MKVFSSSPFRFSSGLSDEGIRAALLKLWEKQGELTLKRHCGGIGLVVGCPVCGKR